MKPGLEGRRRWLDGLMPQRCTLCDEAVWGTLPLCAACAARVPRNHGACPACALPSNQNPPGGALCFRCRQLPEPSLARVIAPFRYETDLALLIHRFKYQRHPQLSATLAQLWIDSSPDLERPDALVPIPLHWRRLLRRGYNQALLLAQGLRRRHPALGAVPCLARGLRRGRGSPQVGKGGPARRSDAPVFTASRRYDNLHIAVVDDVCTTGATAEAAARALRAAGAARVELWCLARTSPPGTDQSALG